ncbi:Cysteine-rich secretory protein family protein [Mariniphaga anaerophila]|uniref:Cysteine-rich secretory protein family protein n=1 Tax=Mariniphaga anaerophila TaxID=1484053 RepID=A0A1M4W4I1_9BACT|nr:CAP domain-containing protein [Mariniphaga anaerophila]SHE75862.1 Cysteine-rich secretory protein family protein [Mariniphaga anaerophila]
MITKVTITFILLFQAISANLPVEKTAPKWEISALDTAAEASYLSSLEKEIILEINKLRTNPKGYAEAYISPLAKRYNRRLLYYPGDKPLLTKEGVNALYECVRDLKRQQPLSIVHPSPGLTLAARDHVKDQSKSGRTGHVGGDKSSMRDRIERYGKWEVRIAENIAYGGVTAQQIVVYLLIDDGVRNRGHRINFLNPDFRMVGVATGDHPEYGIMSVMDFAGGFKNN